MNDGVMMPGMINAPGRPLQTTRHLRHATGTPGETTGASAGPIRGADGGHASPPRHHQDTSGAPPGPQRGLTRDGEGAEVGGHGAVARDAPQDDAHNLARTSRMTRTRNTTSRFGGIHEELLPPTCSSICRWGVLPRSEGHTAQPTARPHLGCRALACALESAQPGVHGVLGRHRGRPFAVCSARGQLGEAAEIVLLRGRGPATKDGYALGAFSVEEPDERSTRRANTPPKSEGPPNSVAGSSASHRARIRAT